MKIHGEKEQARPFERAGKDLPALLAYNCHLTSPLDWLLLKRSVPPDTRSEDVYGGGAAGEALLIARAIPGRLNGKNSEKLGRVQTARRARSAAGAHCHHHGQARAHARGGG